MSVQSSIIVEAKDVDFRYSGEWGTFTPAVSGINFTVKQGDYLALVGPNGSGKTTLLKLFNALLIPSAGEVLVKGISTADESNLPEIRRSCGMIFQNPDNQLVATTVEEDIAFGLENLALPPEEIRKRVSEAAATLGLEKLLKQPPHLLSGGEKQRVAIAGVLVMEPECILMDEPTAMLDPAGRRDVLETVQQLNRDRSIAVIHVTHFPEEAALAGRVAVLNEGRLVADGRTEDVMTDLPFLHGLGLQGTSAVELAFLLRRDGCSLPPKILRNRELVDSLCSLEQNS